MQTLFKQSFSNCLILALLGIYQFIPGLMSLTLVRVIKCKSGSFLDSHSLYFEYIYRKDQSNTVCLLVFIKLRDIANTIFPALHLNVSHLSIYCFCLLFQPVSRSWLLIICQCFHWFKQSVSPILLIFFMDVMYSSSNGLCSVCVQPCLQFHGITSWWQRRCLNCMTTQQAMVLSSQACHRLLAGESGLFARLLVLLVFWFACCTIILFVGFCVFFFFSISVFFRVCVLFVCCFF